MKFKRDAMVVDTLADFFASFVLGLLTPLTAVCVLPLYPGFLAYLSNRGKGNSFMYGLIVTAGVILFMFLIGLVFTTLLEASLTNIIGIISPIAFIILALVSILMILDIDITFLPQVHAPVGKNPYASAFIFGFFFGAIVLPCNPGLITAFFAKSLLSMNFLVNIINFILFGLGMAFPLLVFSYLSSASSRNFIGLLASNKRKINLAAGIIMLIISVYYLIFVFQIFNNLL